MSVQAGSGVRSSARYTQTSSLMNCRSCGQQISSRAINCPHCKAPRVAPPSPAMRPCRICGTMLEEAKHRYAERYVSNSSYTLNGNSLTANSFVSTIHAACTNCGEPEPLKTGTDKVEKVGQKGMTLFALLSIPVMAYLFYWGVTERGMLGGLFAMTALPVFFLIMAGISASGRPPTR